MRHFVKALKSAYKGYFDDKCYLKASALSFYSLISIVPVLAVAFGIAKGFGFKQILEDQIIDTFYQQPQFAEKLIQFANSTLDQAKGGVIAGAGIVMLLWTTFGLLGNFEEIINEIWRAHEVRRYSRRVPDYLTIIILTPIFLASTGTLTVMLTRTLVDITQGHGIYDIVKPLIYVTYYSLLLLLSCLFFTFVFRFLPNKLIPWSSSLLAGVIAGIFFQIIQWSYIHLQIYLTSYNAIYGSFAAIPLFLIWVQLSWLIVLVAAEVGSHYNELS